MHKAMVYTKYLILVLSMCMSMYLFVSFFRYKTTQMNDVSSSTPSTISSKKATVSYAVYVPHNSSNKSSGTRCLENIAVFIERGIFESDDVNFIFIIVGDSRLPPAIILAAKVFKNVDYIRSEKYPVDLYAHGDVIRKSISSTNKSDYFMLLNCGSRGPYFPSVNPYERPQDEQSWSTTWLGQFTSKLEGLQSVAAVGATISCEVRPHVQTYAVALSSTGAEAAAYLWGPINSSSQSTTKLQIIR